MCTLKTSKNFASSCLPSEQSSQSLCLRTHFTGERPEAERGQPRAPAHGEHAEWDANAQLLIKPGRALRQAGSDSRFERWLVSQGVVRIR